MDMELSESRYEHNRESRYEYDLSGDAHKEENAHEFDEDGVGYSDHSHDKSGILLAKDKEKVRDSGKHRSKDRKKERKDEKSHVSRERERQDNDNEENGSEMMEIGHAFGSRERRKEEDKEKNRVKMRDKDYDRDRHRDRDHGKDKDKDKDKEKEQERARDRGKERERDRELDERSLEREYGRGKDHDRGRERDRDRERERDRNKEHERSKGRERDHEKEMDRDHDREKERDRAKDKEKDKEKVKDRDKEKDKERDRLERTKSKDKSREREKDKDRDRKLEKDHGKEKDREREKDKVSVRNREQDFDKETGWGKEEEREARVKLDHDDSKDATMQRRDICNIEDADYDRGGAKDYKQKTEPSLAGTQPLSSELESRITKMKEERLKNKSDSASEVLSWVNKSRRLEEKQKAEKEKALQLAKIFEEQDKVGGESDEEEMPQHPTKDLAGVKILHGLDKVMEGGAVVLTLKDQSILADGDINEEADTLENVEIGEQKQRDEAYRAAKKKTGVYDDKFSDDPGSEKRILPQYDDHVEEGVTLDESGCLNVEAEKKLEELRRRIYGTSRDNLADGLTATTKTSTDYYTSEEMLRFKKPKRKKSLRKKEKLDLDALEAEAISAGLGAGDLGSRNEERRQSSKAEKEKAEADMRNNAYQAAYAKAGEATKVLRQEQTLTIETEKDDEPVFGEEDDDLYKSIEKARKLALKSQDAATSSSVQLVARVADANNELEENPNHLSGEIVFTEMQEFVSKIHLDEETHKPETEDVFKDEEVPKSLDLEMEEAGGWTEVKNTIPDEMPADEEKEDVVPDEIIHERPVGKGLSGTLELLKERGTLKETVEWGGRNMDKKKSKLVGICEDDGPKEIRIERLDEFGRIMTPKEAFRMISHKFHGKGPGKMKMEKKLKKYHEEMKLKHMKASDTPSESMERIRETQAILKTPYLVLSGHVRPGQTSDPRSGFATVEKDLGSLTPMLGDRKVEHFLGIKRKAEPSNMAPPKKPKT